MSNDRRPVGKIPLQKKLVLRTPAASFVPPHGVAPETSPATSADSPAPSWESGVDAEGQALRALGEQTGFRTIDLREATLDLSHLELVPREVAEALHILPVVARGDRLELAMADPRNGRIVDEIEFVTGKKVEPLVASPAILVRTIVAAYDARSRGETRYQPPRPVIVPQGTPRGTRPLPR
jgi:hypothetical protein